MNNCENCKSRKVKDVVLNNKNVGSYLRCLIFDAEVLKSDVCQYWEGEFQEYDLTDYSKSPEDDYF